MDKRLHLYYSGSVQGVGFRYTAERAASSMGLKGWVKNLRDGRVEVLAEGGEATLKKFMRKMDGAFSPYIRNVDTQWTEAAGEFADFDIRF